MTLSSTATEPTPETCRAVHAALQRLHGKVVRRPARASRRSRGMSACGAVPTVLDALIRTLLSQNTTNRNSGRAMDGFLARFGGDYEVARRAPVEAIVESIACGGLANVKGARIKAILQAIHDEHGVTSLEHLRHASTQDVTRELIKYPGVGPKTAGCVLLFCLERDVFAVDTHIFRLTKALGWVHPRANRIQAQAHLDATVPDDLKHALHVLLIRHGQSCPRCAANGRPQRRPRGPCPLQDWRFESVTTAAAHAR